MNEILFWWIYALMMVVGSGLSLIYAFKGYRNHRWWVGMILLAGPIGLWTLVIQLTVGVK